MPPESLLLGALRWLEILESGTGVPRARALLTTHSNYSDLTPTQYSSALSWLKDLGLLRHTESATPAPLRILEAIFEKSPPAWVQDADNLVRSPDELPSDAISAGNALGLDPRAVFAQLVSSWGKVDTAARERAGAAGEAELVSVLRRCTSGFVDHVSMRSDGFGYDVSYRDGDTLMHLEVKSTTRRGRFTFYLSRNEFNVMLSDEQWVLVTVKLDFDLKLVGVGHIPGKWILSNAPQDVPQFASWASSKFEVPSRVIEPGIPQIRTVSAGCLPGWGSST